MSMYNVIKDFSKQFSYEPEIINADKLGRYEKFIVCGMGGSHLAADLIKVVKPTLDILVHSSYGLPALAENVLRNSLIIVNSYSGNTEEVIDNFNKAKEKKLPMAAISIGGKLLDLAKRDGISYVQMPDWDIQPRSAPGLNIKALLKLIGENDLLAEISFLADTLNSSQHEEAGRLLASRIKGYIPVIYSSLDNSAIVYNWKIKFNETGKIPAFYNIFPELNHNEMTGFDVEDTTRSLSKNFYFVILKDKDDHPRILKRMEVLEKLYKDRGLTAEVIMIEGSSRLHKIFSSLILADWASYYTAELYGLESEQVPLVEEFKKMIQG